MAASIRTEFLVMVHKIVATPFEIIRETKMMDLDISKFFIRVLSFYTKVLEFSKTFMAMLDTSETARELYKSLYELTLMGNFIFGIHPDATRLYENKLNINLKSGGFIDYFVMSEIGITQFRNFFRGAHNVKNPGEFDLEVSMLVAGLFLDLCDRAKNYLVESANNSRTLVVLDEIINNLKHLAEFSNENRKKLGKNLSLISKI